MKTINLKLLYFILLLFVLNSCATPRMFTTLDVLHPAEVTFAPEVQNVLIVNNSVVQSENAGHYILNSYLDRYYPASLSLKFDSAALFCAASLRENLESNQFFNSVSMSQTNMNTTGNYYKTSPLTKQTVRFLCNLYNSDAVVSLDHIHTTDIIIKNSGDNLSALDVMIDSKWTIHYPTDSVSNFKNFTDKFSWEEEKINSLPNRYDALVDACILTGSNISDRMIPQWGKEDRYFYAPKKSLFVQAMDSVTYRKWPAAIELWKKASTTSKSSRTKFHAYNNIAIGYEIMGDFDYAMLYASKAIEIYPYIIIFSTTNENRIYELMDYYDTLKNRKEEAKLLDRQLGN